MITVQIHLKSSSAITIKDVTAVNVFYGNGMKTYEADDFNLIPVKEQLPYTFISSKETISVPGTEILYIEFVDI